MELQGCRQRIMEPGYTDLYVHPIARVIILSFSYFCFFYLMSGYLIHITGLVQGVGFRPFVYRMAHALGITGSVENSNDGVWIRIVAGDAKLEAFIRALRAEAPPAALIRKIVVVEQKDLPEYREFSIHKSKDLSDDITLVSPDIAVCEACLADMKRQPLRMDYPFINCTNCGPRFSIIEDLPYDRARTTMQEFRMCPDCRKEYEDILDRRFHAQPVACSVCGPRYTMHFDHQKITDPNEILRVSGQMIREGGILAVKGLGGYFMACDARNEEAVSRLRQAKLREDKPFAVMFRDLDILSRYARFSGVEKEVLQSWRRPIVLLRSTGKLAPSVNMGFNTVGAMLPYMPFHYLLFREKGTGVLVMTSGNLSDEPIVIGNREAMKRISPVTDAVITYNRKIYNRVDDSVVQVVGEHPYIIRRSRGYVPAPVEMQFSVDGILATGAELVNTFCLGKNNLAFPGQHIGDLKNAETYAFYTESLERFLHLFRITPQTVACDMHPDYLSTRYAEETGLPVIPVQHHHAHIASGMVSYGLDEPVIGVAFDGTGLGTDGKIWGGEFMVCDLQHFERKAHLAYVPMPGGDLAALQPWRMALAYLTDTFGDDIDTLSIPFLRWLRQHKPYDLMRDMIRKKINTPLTSSTGRLFDAIAALTGICRESTFHAEAPMRLETAVDETVTGEYAWRISQDILDLRPLIADIVKEIQSGTSPDIIATRFHLTMVGMISVMCDRIRIETGLNKVVLSGGSFQNRFMLYEATHKLRSHRFEVFVPEIIPVNDAGISLGQLAVAGARMRKKK